MIVKGPYALPPTNFALPGADLGSYNFDQYAVNITLFANASAAVLYPVAGAVSADVGRACAPREDGVMVPGPGFPSVVCQSWYNAPLQSTEYYSRVTCGHTPTKTQLTGAYASLGASGFVSAPTPAAYVVARSGVINTAALKGMPGVGRGLGISTFTDAIPVNLSTYSVIFVACDNLANIDSGGTLAVSGNTATFTYTKPVPVRPVLVAELAYTGEVYYAAIITDITLTHATITFKNTSGGVVNFPGGRLSITGIMFTE